MSSSTPSSPAVVQLATGSPSSCAASRRPGYGFVYPALIRSRVAPVQGDPGGLLTHAKAINSVLMSLTVVPAYLLARRLVAPAPALGAAVLAVLVPSMLYHRGRWMTENAFLPALHLVLALPCSVQTLEKPSVRRQVLLLVLCGLAYATRAQAVALVPALVVAPVLLGVIEKNVRGAVRSFAPLYGILIAGAVLALAGTVLRGRSPLSLLGAYRAATNESYSVHEIAKCAYWHVAEIDLYLGVIPFAALLALWLSARSLPPAARAFAAASLPVCVFLIAEVAAFATQPSVQRIEERNMFYLAPLAFIALFAVDCLRRPGQAWRAPWPPATAKQALLPVTFPFQDFIGTKAQADTFALLPWWWVNDHVLAGGPSFATRRSPSSVLAVALFCSAAARRASSFVLPLLVGAFLVVDDLQRRERPARDSHQLRRLALRGHQEKRTATGSTMAVGRDADVSVVWSGINAYSVWENEFFSRSTSTRSTLRPDAAHAGRLSRDGALHEVRDGRLANPSGHITVDVEYALAAEQADAWRTVVASDPRNGLNLVRVDGPLVLQTHVSGVYPDAWSGRQVAYTRFDCTGGKISVVLQSDAHLFTSDQVVTATTAGKVIGVAHVAPIGERRLTVPLLLLDAEARDAGSSSPRRTFAPRQGQGGEHGYARARRSHPALRLPAMRIAFDVSPLSHERTGVNNYIRGTLGGPLPRSRPKSAATRSLRSRRRRPTGKRVIFPRRCGPASTSSCGSCRSLARHVWRERLVDSRSPGRRAAGCRPAFDALHFVRLDVPGPQRAGVRATTISPILVPLHHPEWTTRYLHALDARPASTATRRGTCDVMFLPNSAFAVRLTTSCGRCLGSPATGSRRAHPGIAE